MKRKSEAEKNAKKMQFLFRKLTAHLKDEIEKGNPSDVVIKETRQLLKDFSWMLDVDKTLQQIRTLENAVNTTGAVHPFPVDKQA